MSYNPFDVLQSDLTEIKETLKNLAVVTAQPPVEIIDTKELCKRLAISEPTAIAMRKRRLPHFRVGNSIRFNWIEVVKFLEQGKKK